MRRPIFERQDDFREVLHDPAPGARIKRFLAPLGAWMAQRAGAGRPFVLGMAGAQGSGKSTLAHMLKDHLADACGLGCVILSLDDFYRTREERLLLAREAHPLLRTRGVPGTHDIGLLNRTLDALVRPGAAQIPIPRFDKLRDDREPQDRWANAAACSPVILLEGWCVGAAPQAAAALAEPINTLEAGEDPDGAWRRHVNNALSAEYAELFARLDARLFLRAPSFAPVLEWRLEQETGLTSPSAIASERQDRTALSRFIMHYERLTRHMMETSPTHCDVLIELAADRRALSIEFRS